MTEQERLKMLSAYTDMLDTFTAQESAIHAEINRLESELKTVMRCKARAQSNCNQLMSVRGLEGDFSALPDWTSTGMDRES